MYDFIIIGGGISGVSFAHYSSKDSKKVLILEGENRLGGRIHTELINTESSQYVELGAHSCYHSYTTLLDIVKDLSLEEEVLGLGKGKFKLWDKGKVVSLFSKLDKLALLPAIVKYFKIRREGKTAKKYFTYLVGEKNYSRVLQYMFRAVICQEADNYPAELFLKSRKSKYKDFPKKFTFKGGLSSFLYRIVESDQVEYSLNSKVSKIAKEVGEYKVYVEDKVYKAKNIVFATDIKSIKKIIGSINKDIETSLNNINIAESQSTSVLVKGEMRNVNNIAGVVSTSDDFYSMMCAPFNDDQKERSFTVYHKNELNISINSLFQINENQIVNKIKSNHILPQVNLGNMKDIENIDSELNQNKNLFIVGNYFKGMSLEDCVIRAKEEYTRYKKESY